MNTLAVKFCCGLVWCASLVACASERKDIRNIELFDVTLVAGVPADKRWGLRLLRVDRDGTAYIKSPYRKRVYRVRPEEGHDDVPPFVLEQTDAGTQTAKLRTFMD